MAVYLFTQHAYRTWNADRPQGYVKHKQGIQLASSKLAHAYNLAAKDDPVIFTSRHQDVIRWILWDACQRRGWRLHYVATDSTHVHVLVSWVAFQRWEPVRAKFKNLISWALTNEFDAEGKRWLTGKGSRKQVRDHQHFEHLVNTYLPGHGGLCWREGDAPPPAPAWSCKVGRAAKHPLPPGCG